MSDTTFETVLGAVITFGGLLSVVSTLRHPSVDDTVRTASQKTLEERLDELSQSMRQSARLVEAVSAELEARAAIAKQLKDEAKTAQAISELHHEQMEAVSKVFDARLTGATRRIRGDSIKIGIASFIAGGGVSFVVTLLVHPLK